MTSAILGGYHMGLELECDISLEWATGRFWKGVRGLGSASPFPKKIVVPYIYVPSIRQAEFRGSHQHPCPPLSTCTSRSSECCWATDRPHVLLLLPLVQETLPFRGLIALSQLADIIHR